MQYIILEESQDPSHENTLLSPKDAIAKKHLRVRLLVRYEPCLGHAEVLTVNMKTATPDVQMLVGCHYLGKAEDRTFELTWTWHTGVLGQSIFPSEFRTHTDGN